MVRFVIFHPWKTATILVVGVILGLGSFYVHQVSTALGSVATEDFDPVRARLAIEEATQTVATTPPSTVAVVNASPSFYLPAELASLRRARAEMEADQASTFNTAAFGEPIDDSVFDAYLLVGTDASGFLADTIILALQPSSGGAPMMVSLPRDLFVWNECKQTFTRLNAGLGGCSSVASGFELLAIMVEDYTGIPIDHLARINFGGFARVVDAMGGISVCVDHPRRDLKSHLLVETTGCQTVDGETALAWVRSRHPEERVDGEWVRVGGSDFGRQRAQQDVLFQLAGRAASFSSPGALVERLSAVASSVRLDSSWSFGDAVGTAWRYRGVTRDDVKRFSISVGDYRTSYGAQVLLPRHTFREDLATVYDMS